LYQTERWGMSAYCFDAPNGIYQVVLHFAEIFCTHENKRTMSVTIEGQTVLDKLDIYGEVGHDAALRYTYSNISVTDERLDIIFNSIREQPKISAIEVICKTQNDVINNYTARAEKSSPIIPVTVVLHQNNPNPFNSATTIHYDLSCDAKITLKIFNILGQAIYTLEDTHKRAGVYSVVWDAQDEWGRIVTSGIYFYQVEIVPRSTRKERIRLVKKMFFGK